jgi:hypothetical protein
MVLQVMAPGILRSAHSQARENEAAARGIVPVRPGLEGTSGGRGGAPGRRGCSRQRSVCDQPGPGGHRAPPTFATASTRGAGIQAGYPPKMLQEIMRHASITTTLDLSVAPLPGDLDRDADRLDSAQTMPVQASDADS